MRGPDRPIRSRGPTGGQGRGFINFEFLGEAKRDEPESENMRIVDPLLQRPPLKKPKEMRDSRWS